MSPLPLDPNTFTAPTRSDGPCPLAAPVEMPAMNGGWVGRGGGEANRVGHEDTEEDLSVDYNLAGICLPSYT